MIKDRVGNEIGIGDSFLYELYLSKEIFQGKLIEEDEEVQILWNDGSKSPLSVYWGPKSDPSRTMKIMKPISAEKAFKYDLKQIIFFMHNNKVTSAEIVSRMIIENAYEQLAGTDYEKEMYIRFGRNIVRYATKRGILNENQIFSTKEELLESL